LVISRRKSRVITDPKTNTSSYLIISHRANLSTRTSCINLLVQGMGLLIKTYLRQTTVSQTTRKVDVMRQPTEKARMGF
jgi:hypothetical protein